MNPEKIIVIFTEGETDEVFYKKLCDDLGARQNAKLKLYIKNLKGVGRYENKAPAKLKHEIIAKYPNIKIVVFCSYDTDVFSIPFQQKPPVDWTKIEQKMRNLGIGDIYHIKADKMIEDWFLLDIESICKFLNIPLPKKIQGKNGFEKLKFVFKKGNKIYQKGYNVNNFVEQIDVHLIYEKLKNTFKELNEEINKK